MSQIQVFLRSAHENYHRNATLGQIKKATTHKIRDFDSDLANYFIYDRMRCRDLILKKVAHIKRKMIF
jgi:hypothetical protein